jgi:hypothetical protein
MPSQVPELVDQFWLFGQELSQLGQDRLVALAGAIQDRHHFRRVCRSDGLLSGLF